VVNNYNVRLLTSALKIFFSFLKSEKEHKKITYI